MHGVRGAEHGCSVLKKAPPTPAGFLVVSKFFVIGPPPAVNRFFARSVRGLHINIPLHWRVGEGHLNNLPHLETRLIHNPFSPHTTTFYFHTTRPKQACLAVADQDEPRPYSSNPTQTTKNKTNTSIVVTAEKPTKKHTQTKRPAVGVRLETLVRSPEIARPRHVLSHPKNSKTTAHLRCLLPSSKTRPTAATATSNAQR